MAYEEVSGAEVSKAQAQRQSGSSGAELNDLPTEVLTQIFSEVGAEDLMSLLSMQRVCLRWRDAISASQELQEQLFFRPARSEALSTVSLTPEPPMDLTLQSGMIRRDLWEVEDDEDLNPVVEHCFRLLVDQDFARDHGKDACNCRYRPRHDIAGLFQFNHLPFVQTPGRRNMWLSPEASWRRMMLSEEMITSWTIVEFKAPSLHSFNAKSETVTIWVEDFQNAAPGQPKYLTMGYYFDTLLHCFEDQPYMRYDWFLFRGMCFGRLPAEWHNITEGRDARYHYSEYTVDDPHHAILIYCKAVKEEPESGRLNCTPRSMWTPRPIGGVVGKPLLRLTIKEIVKAGGLAWDFTPDPDDLFPPRQNTSSTTQDAQ